MQVVELSDLDGHAAAWDELVDSMDLPSPFLRSWWLRAVDEGAGAYLLVLDGTVLVGGLPLTRRTLPGLAFYRFVGHGILCPDHMDVVARPVQAPVVSAALAGWARGRGNRLFDLSGVAEGSRIASWLPGARVDARESAPWAELPASVDEYLADRSKSFKKTWRRTRNRLDELGATVHLAGQDELDSALAEFERLHRDRGDREELVAELPRLAKGLAAGVSVGEVWVDVLAAEHRTIGVAISFAACGRLSLYQNTRALDPVADNAGTALGLAAIERAIAAGCTELDLLRGEESYKFNWGARQRTMTRVRGAHGPVAVGLLIAVEFARRALHLARRVSRGLRASADGSGSAPRSAPASPAP